MTKRRYLFHHEAHDESDAGKYHPHEPEAHNDGFLGPSYGFEVMMERSDSEYFFPVSKLLGRELDDDGTYLEDIDPGYDDENRESIGHHRHDSEVCPEGERAYVAHIETRGFYIEPEKCYERSDDEHANSWEDHKPLIVGNERIHDVIKEEESACEPVESICDIYRVCHRDDDEDKKGNIENTEAHFTEKREVKSGVSEFHIEPISSDESEYCQ